MLLFWMLCVKWIHVWNVIFDGILLIKHILKIFIIFIQIHCMHRRSMCFVNSGSFINFAHWLLLLNHLGALKKYRVQTGNFIQRYFQRHAIRDFRIKWQNANANNKKNIYLRTEIFIIVLVACWTHHHERDFYLWNIFNYDAVTIPNILNAQYICVCCVAQCTVRTCSHI